jgi:multiple sugar transport system permease protein
MTSVAVANTDANPTGPARRPLSRRLDRLRFNPVSLLLLAPAAIVLIALFIAPICYAVYLGFTNLQLIGPRSARFSFTGMQNVYTLLSDDVMLRSVWLTVVFVVGSGAIGTTALGLVIALAMRQGLPILQFVVSGLAIVAWTLPPTTIAIIWYAATTHGGVIPTLLGMPGYDLLYDRAMLIVSFANSWSLAGLAMIMFSAALRNLPTDIDEAAMLENASPTQRLVRLTLPLLKPTMVTSALLMTLLSFANFTLIYLMTAGGPSNDTNILPVYSYLQGFKFYRLGYAALLGNVMVILSALIGAIFVFVGRSRRR